jgi:TPR repeat protein
MNLIEELPQRHEAEISICLERRQHPARVAGHSFYRLEPPRPSDKSVYRLELAVKGSNYIGRPRSVSTATGKVQDGLSLLNESVEFGHSDSIIACRLIHEAGKLCAQNLEAAAEFFQISTMEGNGFGQYKHGLGVPRNENEKIRFVKLSADQGNPSW